MPTLFAYGGSKAELFIRNYTKLVPIYFNIKYIFLKYLY